MKSFILPVTFLTLLLLSINLLAQNKGVQTAPVPDWITVNPIDYKNDKLNGEADDGYIDLAYERQVLLSQQAVYSRKAIRVLTDAGVQNSSEINIGYDPSYESIIFHDIHIRRGNVIHNKLDRSKIKILQQEEELDMHLYNGSLSAVLFLEDVRKGDVIEYSYTRKGFNPIFKGKYTDRYQGNFSVPVGFLFYKLIVPNDRTLAFKKEGNMDDPKVIQKASETTYEWKRTDLLPLHVEDQLPSWYNPYSSMSVSEFKSWKEVNDWSLALFSTDRALSGQLKEKIEEIKKAHKTVEEQTVAALRFVQDEIRYMGMEIGEGSHQPNNPNKVFAQRFGDCKDKTYLLLTILRHLNIECYPVLINTDYKKALLNWLPSATAFDHVTIQVKLNSKTYWFDPTISYQRGTVQQIAYPDYQVGLVVSPTTTALSEIPLQDNSRVKVKELFVVKDRKTPVRLIVTTKYTGYCADNMRSDFNASNLHDMKKGFEKFYKGYYEELKIDSLTYKDDEISGELTTYEWYTIPDFWEKKDGELKASFAPYMINSVLKTPTDTKRSMPFYISYPVKYVEDIIVELPTEWDVTESFDQLKNTNFLMGSRFSYSDKVLKLHYTYESLKDHIAPAEAQVFFADMKKADKEMGYQLTWSSDEAVAHNTYKSLNTVNDVYGVLYVLLGICVFITFLVKLNKRKNARWF